MKCGRDGVHFYGKVWCMYKVLIGWICTFVNHNWLYEKMLDKKRCAG